MSNKHDLFDDRKLTELKNMHCGYRYCPKCGGPLEEREVEHAQRMICPDEECGYIFYQNPIPAAGVIVVRE